MRRTSNFFSYMITKSHGNARMVLIRFIMKMHAFYFMKTALTDLNLWVVAYDHWPLRLLFISFLYDFILNWIAWFFTWMQKASPSSLSVQLMDREGEKMDVPAVSIDPDFADYLYNDFLAVLPSQREPSDVFLQRYVRVECTVYWLTSVCFWWYSFGNDIKGFDIILVLNHIGKLFSLHSFLDICSTRQTQEGLFHCVIIFIKDSSLYCRNKHLLYGRLYESSAAGTESMDGVKMVNGLEYKIVCNSSKV